VIDPVKVALTQYPVAVEGDIGQLFVKCIMEETNQRANKGYRPPKCKGFCTHLNLKEAFKDKANGTDGEVQQLMSLICLALLGSYIVGHTQERQARVIKDINAPVIVDGFVGLCC
jgi:hypothetical protein